MTLQRIQLYKDARVKRCCLWVPQVLIMTAYIAYSPKHYVGVGQRVRVTGLQAKPELNGCLARVTGDPRNNDRVPVALDSGAVVSIRPTNLEHVSEAPLCELHCRDAVLLADRAEACCCETIRDALELSGEDEAMPMVPLPLVDAASVSKALRICHTESPMEDLHIENGRGGDATRFQLLRAATFLDCPVLLERVSEDLADQIRQVCPDPKADPYKIYIQGTSRSESVAAAEALRARFSVVQGLLSNSDINHAASEGFFTPPFAGKKRVALCWPEEAIEEDHFEAALIKLAPAHLRFVKGVCHGWRAAARRVLCSAHYQATHYTLSELVCEHQQSIAGRLAGVLARIDAHPSEAEPKQKNRRTPWFVQSRFAPNGPGYSGDCLPVEWGLCECLWVHITLGDGRLQRCKSIRTKAEGAAFAAAILSRMQHPPKAPSKSWEMVLGTAPLFRSGSIQNETDAEAAALAIRTLLRPTDKGGYGLGTTGLVPALDAYMEATPPCDVGKHVRAAVVKELARWKRAEEGSSSRAPETAKGKRKRADGDEQRE